ncbi:hypothetical protein [Enterovirga sp.]|jgi:hypothetical protein|uniref:hypothetical protein n=1 Tax=Enterovirga sp. TaxID=2026350 RepID=UPI002637D9E6|nr:hypothetical protein [Enterovirga sp.]MDB5589807.1 hypothetical protein [Enterovirga sp.]
MVTPFIAIRLAAATLLLGSVALAGDAMAKPAANETTLASMPAAMPTAVVAAAPMTVEDSASGCARKVKVVYAGYGEADRMGCAREARSAAR